LSTFTVTNLNDSGAGSLRSAIALANANPGSTINFAPGLTGSINLNSQLVITTGVEIDGPGALSLTLNGQHRTRVIAISQPISKDVTINDLTIANGLAGATGGGYYGGGIFDINASSLTLSRVNFTNNQAVAAGAGLYCQGGGDPVTITDCNFTSNRIVG